MKTQGTQNMKNITFSVSSNDQQEKTTEDQKVTPSKESSSKVLTPFSDELTSFETAVAREQYEFSLGKSDGAIEASEDVIKYFNPHGLGNSQYFFYKNIKVYPVGKRDEIEEMENEQMGRRLFGKSEGYVEGF